MSYWLLITSPHNYSACLSKRMWGDVSHDRIQELQVGDGCIFYLTDSGRLLGSVASVSSRPYRVAETPWWTRYYPWVVDLQVLTRVDILIPGDFLGLGREVTMGYQGRFCVRITRDMYERYLKRASRQW